jgi:polysaccharide pyruvyl transferase WcaK-like protein
MKKNKRKKIVFFGHFDSSNFGNESTLQAILFNLDRFRPDAEVMCISTGSETTAIAHEITAIPISSTFLKNWTPGNRLMRALRKICIGLLGEPYTWVKGLIRLKSTAMLIVPGTGLLTDAYGLLGWGPYNLFKWSAMAKLSGCKLLFVSVGAGPIYGRLGRVFVRSVLSLADFRSYRDRTTLQYLRGIGFLTDSDRVYPDLAFSLPEAVIPRHDTRKSGRPVVGLGLMAYAGKYSVFRPINATYSNYINQLAIFTKWLLDNEYDVRLLSGDLGDNPARQEFRQLLRHTLTKYDEGRVIDEPIKSVEDLLLQISKTDSVVATRFHNVVFALLCNKPVISISFHHKCESLMGAVGLSDYCLKIDYFRGDKLIDKFHDLEINADTIKRLVQQKTKEFRDSLDEQYKYIFNNL